MDIRKLYEEHSIHHWKDYFPHDGHYGTFDPNVVATGFKISDTYSSFAVARSFLSDIDVDNFGQLISEHDEFHLTYIRAKLVQSALAFYNYCIDLSWQVLWFYCAPNDYKLIEDEDYYINYSKGCTFENLSFQLFLGNKDGLIEHFRLFWNNKLTGEIRKNYNYLKHRGSFHIEHLGTQSKNFMGTVNGVNYKFISRDTLNVEEWTEKLIQFDISFIYYFEAIIQSIMPKDYINTPLDLFGVVNYHFKRNAQK